MRHCAGGGRRTEFGETVGTSRLGQPVLPHGAARFPVLRDGAVLIRAARRWPARVSKGQVNSSALFVFSLRIRLDLVSATPTILRWTEVMRDLPHLDVTLFGSEIPLNSDKPNEAQPQTVSRWRAIGNLRFTNRVAASASLVRSAARTPSLSRGADLSNLRSGREEFRTVKNLDLFTTSLGVQGL